MQSPTAFKFLVSIPQEKLKLAGDTEIVDIRGMSPAKDGRVLLLPDLFNRRVKALNISTGVVSVHFQENDTRLRVSNVLLVETAPLVGRAAGTTRTPKLAGNVLLVSEVTQGKDGVGSDTRIVVAREDESGTFRESYNLIMARKTKVP